MGKTLASYGKSRHQGEKERTRRRKLRTLLLTHPQPWSLRQQDLAEAVGCSQATVSRDLAVLRGTRWDPYPILQLRRARALWERANWLQLRLDPRILEQLSFQTLKVYINYLIHRTKRRGVPFSGFRGRGKPFTSDYQPRWGKWGIWFYTCSMCGYRGEGEVRGQRWSRGSSVVGTCAACGQRIRITRPKQSMERRLYTAPCGHDLILTLNGLWKSTRLLTVLCPCGKRYWVDKRATRPYHSVASET